MFNLSRIRLIAQREVLTRFRMKAYRWTLIIQVVAAIIAGFLPIAISYFADDTPGGGTVLVVNATDTDFVSILQGNLEADIPGLPAINVEATTDDIDTMRQNVEDGDAVGAVIISQQDADVHYEIVTDGEDALDTTQLRLQSAVAASSVQVQAELTGLSADEAATLVAPPPVTVESPEGTTESTSDNFDGPTFAVVNVGLVIIYMLFILYGSWISTGVVEEKASRIMEIMVNAATPRDLLAGKMLGVLIAGLCQTLPMLIAGALAFAMQPRFADWLGVTLTSTFDLDFRSISFQAFWVVLVYFIGGYALYGALYAAAGSLVSRQEDVAQAISPVMTLIIIGLFVAYAVMAVPNSLLSKILFIVPLTSPYVAMPRILMGDPAAWEIVLSVVLLMITGVLAMVFAGKVYRYGVLMYGQKTSLMQVLRLGNQQQVAR